MSTIVSDLVAWSMHCGMQSAYDGTVSLTNQDGAYDSSLRWMPFQVTTDASVVDSDGIADVSCFEGTIRWIYGIVFNYDESIELTQKTVSLKIGSFVSRLGKKPINTEKYTFEDTSTVLSDMLSIYGGVPAALYDLSGITDEGKIYACVSGNNMLEEMKKVAQTARAHLFVRHDGVLAAEHWKTGFDPIEETIPSTAVNSCSRARDTSVIPSRIIARGRFVSQFDCGEQYLTSADQENPFTPQSFRPHSRQGQIRKCGNVGVGQPKMELDMKNVRGTSTDLRNATYTVEGDGDYDFTNRIQPKSGGSVVTLTVTGPSGGFLTQGSKEFEVKAKGKVKPPNEYAGAQSQMGPLRGAFLKPGTVLGRMARNMTGLPLAEWPEDLLKGEDKDKTADEPDPIRIETIVDDPDLQAEFGVVSEQLENIYAFDHETLFDIAVRKFQEYKMSREVWKVSTTYLPCLRLNQRVVFWPPGEGRRSGIITDIEISYDNSPRIGMNLTIWDVSFLGLTEYTSGNLFLYPELCGTSNTDYTWNDASTLDAYCRMLGGYAALGGTPSGVAEMWQGFDLEIGANYELTYDLSLDSGGSIVVSIEDSGIVASQTHSGSGSYTQTFTPDEKFNSIHWTTASGDWYMSRPCLTKTVTK